MQKVSIRSATFPQCYLRIDGSGISSFQERGAGTVNCQSYVGPYETLDIINQPGQPNDVFAIASTAFSNVFLRMDSRSVHGFSNDGNGTVNCQFGAGPYELFRLERQSDGTQAIASVNFPGTYLRVDGRGVHASNSGSGNVNCQGSVGPYEKVIIGVSGKSLTRKELEQAINTYGPMLKLHPDELYANTSIEYFLRHSKLVDSKSGTSIEHPTADQLPQNGDDKQFYLELEESAKAGDFDQAKAYVHALWTPGQPYTDLQFWLFPAYNGPGTAHINGLVFDTIVKSGDVNLAPMGEHYGDWECVMLRIDNDSKQLVAIWLSQHSDGRMVLQEDISHTFRMERDTHPIVYSSRNGHANHPSADTNYTEHHKVPPVGIPAGIEFYLANNTADGGKVFDCSQKYQVVSADWLSGAEAYEVPKWVEYPYRWGPEGTTTHMSSQTVRDIMNAAAGPLAPFLPGALLLELAGLILPSFVKDDVNGPSAPAKQRTWVGQY